MQKQATLLETFIDFARSYETYLENYVNRFFTPVEKRMYRLHKKQMKEYILINIAKEYGFNYYDLKENI